MKQMTKRCLQLLASLKKEERSIEQTTIKRNEVNQMITSIFDKMDEMWKDMDWFFNRPMQLSNDSGFKSRGLKRIIGRPHSLMTRKDKDGKVVGWALELPYTPFSKNEVNVEVKDNTLVVTCGKENKVRSEEMDFSDISYQMFNFSIPLSDNVDVSKISAKADDGMLYIELPAKAIEEKKSDVLKIEVK